MPKSYHVVAKYIGNPSKILLPQLLLFRHMKMFIWDGLIWAKKDIGLA